MTNKYLTITLILFSALLLFSCSTLSKNSKVNNENFQQAELFTSIGQSQLYKNQTDKAIESFLSAYNYLLLTDYTKEKVNLSLLLAGTFLSIKDTTNYFRWLNSAKMLSLNDINIFNDKLELFNLKQLFSNKNYDQLLTAYSSINISALSNEENAEALTYVLLSKYFLNKDYSSELSNLEDLFQKMTNLYIENDLNNPHILSYISYNLGFINYKTNLFINALDYFKTSLKYDYIIENYVGAAENLFNIADIYKKQNIIDKASNCFLLSSEIYKTLKLDSSYYKTRLSALELLNQSDKSIEIIEEIKKLKELINNN